MFEDSVFASAGRIRSRSRAGLIAASFVETTAVAALVMVPLLYPHMLPRVVGAFLLDAPAIQVEEPKPLVRTEAVRITPAVLDMGIHAPRQIPTNIYIPERAETPLAINTADFAGPLPPASDAFGTGEAANVVRGPEQRTIRVPSSMEEGLLIHKTLPVYPVIARETRTQGTVVLEATISRSGTIENLRVDSGPPMLRQAALDAVSNWRYRPYLLNGAPIEVETTVNVVFRLD